MKVRSKLQKHCAALALKLVALHMTYDLQKLLQAVGFFLYFPPFIPVTQLILRRKPMPDTFPLGSIPPLSVWHDDTLALTVTQPRDH
jgi:hypothetical protein